jgi:hypothetical protein
VLIVADNLQHRSMLRFSLWQLLIVALLVAIGAAVFGPKVRDLTAEQRPVLVKVLIAASSGAVLIIAIFIWRRLRIEKRSGAILCTFEDQSRTMSLRYVAMISSILFAGWVLYELSNRTEAFYRAQVIARQTGFHVSSSPLIVMAIFSGPAVGVAFLAFVWARFFAVVELRANGIVWRVVDLFLWKDVHVRGVNEANHQVTLALKKYNTTLSVPRDCWPQAWDLLQTRAGV